MAALALPGAAGYSVKYKHNSANHVRNPAARSEKAQVTILAGGATPPASHSTFSFTDDVRGVTINLELCAVGDLPAPGNLAIGIPAPWNLAAVQTVINAIAVTLLANNFKTTQGVVGSLYGVTSINARVSGNDSAGVVQLGGGPGFLSSSWKGYAPLVVGLFNLGGFLGMTLANDGSQDRYDSIGGGLVRLRRYFW